MGREVVGFERLEARGWGLVRSLSPRPIAELVASIQQVLWGWTAVALRDGQLTMDDGDGCGFGVGFVFF
jgi:hypothetical protein